MPDPYKDHPFHQGSNEEKETSIIVKQDSDSEDEEEQATAEPNHEKYKPPVPYPQALNRRKAKNSETDDNLLDAFKKVTIIIHLIDAIKHIPSYAKFIKGICTPHRNPKRIQLSETVSSIMMNSLPVKKRDPGAPMIMSEMGGMSFTRSLLDTGASINILPKAVNEEILKWLNAEIIYPISDSQWVSPVHVVPKKAKVMVTMNEKGEEIQTRLPTKWRVCFDYRKLNSATKKDHFPLPFIDQILYRLAGSN